MKKAMLTSALIASMFLLGCSSSTPEADKPLAQAGQPAAPGAGIEAKQAAAEQEATEVTELKFKTGETQLSKGARDRLQTLIKKVGSPKNVEKLVVLSWADQEYPSVHAESLPKAQRELADKRNEAIKNHLKKTNKDFDVETYSMAERPNALQEFLNTSGARWKESLERAGIPNTDTSVKAPSKAGHAIVLVVPED